MNKEKKKTMVPKLRFPEFREAEWWEHYTLGDITIKAGKKNKDGGILPIYSINNKEGFLPQGDQFEGIDSNNRGYDTTLYKVIEKNTFAYNPARIDVGSIGYSGDLNNIIISSLYVCFKTKESVYDAFLMQFLKTSYFNEAVKNTVEGGIRNYLFYENFSIINIYLPKKNEQQKIAATLTSLDDLITAQSEKIKALQRHKKGLMQQLFPAEGETVPRVRFEEFREAGEWESKELGKITTWFSGGTPSKDNPEYWGGEIPWISASSMRGINYSDSKLKLTEVGLKNGSRLAKEGSLLLLVRGSMLFNTVPVGIAGKDVAFNQDLKSIMASKEVDKKYLLYWFLASEQLLMSMVGGTGIGAGKLETSELQKLFVPLPMLPEQQKIAACLTSLDDLITAQRQKLEALKMQKKGLMQGLFPNANDMEA